MKVRVAIPCVMYVNVEVSGSSVNDAPTEKDAKREAREVLRARIIDKPECAPFVEVQPWADADLCLWAHDVAVEKLSIEDMNPDGD